MNSNLRLIILVGIFAVVNMIVIKIYDGQFAFLISGIACAYMGINLNNYIDKRKKQ